jgi:hypothetical protein
MEVSRRTLIATLGSAAVAGPLLASCSRGDTEATTTTPTQKAMTPAPVSGEPGTLLSRQPLTTGIAGARAWHIRYISRDVNDVAHEVSGLVIAPADRGENRPLLTWCHGTTGLGDAACPSAQPDPARELITYFQPEATQQIDYGVPGLQGFIDDGWVVCSTDYQGLGTPGMHQYVVNRTNARDGIYIAHAARQLDAGAGTTLGCAGWSQGGGAAAAIAELDAEDYRDLKLIGTVAMSPGVAKIGLEVPAGMTAALKDPAVPPDSHLVMMLAGVQAANPSTLNLPEAFTALGVGIIETAWNTQPVHHLNDTVARMFRLKGQVLNLAPPNFAAWKAAIVAGSAATRKPVAPVLVCIDEFNGGTVIPVTWQKAYVDAVKRFGGTVEVRDYPRDDHFSLPQSCVADARAWLNRLRG